MVLLEVVYDNEVVIYHVVLYVERSVTHVTHKDFGDAIRCSDQMALMY